MPAWLAELGGDLHFCFAQNDAGLAFALSLRLLRHGVLQSELGCARRESRRIDGDPRR